jgi:hypothetical protein
MRIGIDVMAFLPRMTGIDTCLNQLVRHPPSWTMVRIASSDDTLSSGVVIPKGAKLSFSQYVMHRHTQYYPAPPSVRPQSLQGGGWKTRPRPRITLRPRNVVRMCLETRT